MRPSWPLVASFALPTCFLVGAAANDFFAARRAHDAQLARRVAQALGEWAPPPLSGAARQALEREREDLAREVAGLEARAVARAGAR